MKFIKLFNEQTEFDAAKGTLYNPNVSYIKGNGGVYSLGYTYVDLGLTSGTLWAKCIVGAEKETDYGFYFQWGDIKNKSNAVCDWTTYKHCEGTYNSLKKYNTADGKTTLESEDDAATQIMGDEWRMPTRDEFQELLDNTDNEWIEDFNGSGVNGRKFTSKINGNSIFIPASGVRSGSAFCYQGIFSQVWSSSLVTESPSFAWNLYFNSGGISAHSTSGRYFRFAVRGVTECR